MRGKLSLTLHLFDEKIRFSSKSCIGSDPSEEQINLVADQLREEFGSFKWEEILKMINTKKAWEDKIKSLVDTGFFSEK